MLLQDDSQPIATPKPTRKNIMASQRQEQLLVQAEEAGDIVYPFILNPASSPQDSKSVSSPSKTKEKKRIPSNDHQGEPRVILQLLIDKE